jgi:hypothetical protein
MTNYQSGPTVRLARLKKRESRDGRAYLMGYLGNNKLLLFRDKADADVWNLLLQEPTEAERAWWAQRRADNAGVSTQPSRDRQPGALPSAQASAPATTPTRQPDDVPAAPAVRPQATTAPGTRPFDDPLPFLVA